MHTDRTATGIGITLIIMAVIRLAFALTTGNAEAIVLGTIGATAIAALGGMMLRIARSGAKDSAPERELPIA